MPYLVFFWIFLDKSTKPLKKVQKSLKIVVNHLEKVHKTQKIVHNPIKKVQNSKPIKFPNKKSLIPFRNQGYFSQHMSNVDHFYKLHRLYRRQDTRHHCKIQLPVQGLRHEWAHQKSL